MARRDTIYTVFLSGPSDVTSDSDLVAQVIDEINLLVAHLGFQFDTFHWRHQATPGTADVEAQERINSQVAGYDVIVTIFGTKLGTPTAGHVSGTVEELNIALSRDDLAFGNDSILVFFKNTPLSMIGSDLHAAAELQSYRRSLPPKILFGEFSDDSELRETVLRSFGRILKRILVPTEELPLAASSTVVVRGTAAPVSTTSDGFVEDELGIVDYATIYEEGMATATASTELISKSLQDIGTSAQEATAALQSAEALRDRSAQKRILSRMSDGLVHAAEGIKANTEILRSVIPESLRALERGIELQTADFNQSNTENDVAATAANLARTLDNSAKSVVEFMTAISSSPRMTQEYNRARRILLVSLQDLLGFMEASGIAARELAQRSQVSK